MFPFGFLPEIGFVRHSLSGFKAKNLTGLECYGYLGPKLPFVQRDVL
jgi:hypothetical protein